MDCNTGYKLSILIESPNIFHWKANKNRRRVVGQNLGQIRFSVVKKSKETSIINRIYHIWHGDYILKQAVVVVETPE